MVNYINCCNHPIKLYDQEGCNFDNRNAEVFFVQTPPKTILREWPAAEEKYHVRVQGTNHFWKNIEKVKICCLVDGPLRGMPPFRKGVFCIVSSEAARAMNNRGRYDTVYPYQLVKTKEGELLGCFALAQTHASVKHLGQIGTVQYNDANPVYVNPNLDYSKIETTNRRGDKARVSLKKTTGLIGKDNWELSAHELIQHAFKLI